MASTQQSPAQSKGLHTAEQPNFVEESNDFSLELGGPVFQLFRKSHLAGDGLTFPGNPSTRVGRVNEYNRDVSPIDSVLAMMEAYDHLFSAA